MLIITGTSGLLPAIFTPRALAASTTSTVCASSCKYTDVQVAVNAANPGDTIQLNEDLSIGAQITITKPLTLDGNGHTISPTFPKSNNSNNSSIGIDGTQDVTVSNLTIDGTAGTNLHGINIYESTNVSLNNVTSKNNDRDGIVVNGSTVTVEDLSTSGNGWGGIDVDQGSGVTNPALLTVNAASYQEELVAIKIDNTAKNAHVIDASQQYTYTDSFSPARIFTQIPTGIANHSPSDGAYTTTAGLTTIAWLAATSPHGPLSYYYESSHSSSTKADGSFTSPAYGPVSTGTNTSIPAPGTPEGVWYWHVRAKDSVGNYSAWTTPWKVTVDNTAPAAPAIKTPTPRQWFKSTPILDSWSATTDNLSGVGHYQIAYLYDDGHTFGGSTCPGIQINGKSVSGCRDTTSTSRGHVPGTNEQGGVTIWVRAFDNSGNASPWSLPVHYYYDSSAPTNVDVTFPANGTAVRSTGDTLTITGTALDNLFMNRVGVQLVKPGISGQIAYIYANGNKMVYTNPGAWQATFDTNALKLADGTYGINVYATDMAGNTTVKKVTFMLDNTQPTITFVSPSSFNKPFQTGPNLKIQAADQNGSGIASTVIHIYASDNKTLVKSCSISYADTATCDTSTLADGTYAIHADATDTAGNNQTITTHSFTIDSTPPAVTDNFTVNMLTGDKVTLQPAVTDASPVTYQWQVSDSKLLNNPQDTRDGTSLEIGPAPKDDYTVTLTVTDAAGNHTTKQYAVTISTAAQTPSQNKPQVLGAQTLAVTHPESGQVLGDSTAASGQNPQTKTGTGNGSTPGNDNTVKVENAAAAKSSAFLRLGWWWFAALPIAAIIIVLFASLRSSSNKKSS